MSNFYVQSSNDILSSIISISIFIFILLLHHLHLELELLFLHLSEHFDQHKVQRLSSSSKIMLESKYFSTHTLWTIITFHLFTIFINVYLMLPSNIWSIS